MTCAFCMTDTTLFIRSQVTNRIQKNANTARFLYLFTNKANYKNYPFLNKMTPAKQDKLIQCVRDYYHHTYNLSLKNNI